MTKQKKSAIDAWDISNTEVVEFDHEQSWVVIRVAHKSHLQ